ncbi:hypothetical protein IFR05_006556 [Cadophora sp. M221]|nr:hypothetical protein IFR05_006556 [Cadophora sp. M221]
MAHTQEKHIVAASAEVDPIIMYEVSSEICNECQELVASLFTDDEEMFEARWRYLGLCDGYKRRPSKLWAYATHHSDRHDGLHTSFTAGCSLCGLLFTTCSSVYGKTPTQQPYCIVGLDNPGYDLAFYLCFCEISALENEGDGFDFRDLNAIPFRFSFRNGDESDFRFFRGLRRPKAMMLAPNISLVSEEAVDRARGWYKDCRGKHSNCRRIASPLPKRVLDLAQAATGVVVLYESEGEIAEYATLSYSWGTALPLKTLRSNIEQHRKGLAVESLPRTLRDAVHMSQLLDFRYIWIDALCIIQDDTADWVVQGSLMTDIYEGSTLCISTLSANDCHSGFLELPDTLSKVGIYHYFTQTSDESRDIFVGQKPSGYGNVVEKSHLCTRGWTFQERLVSPASLHYTDEGMFWECVEEFLSETGSGRTPYSPDGWKKSWRVVRDGKATVLTEHLGAGSELSLEKATVLRNWGDFVGDYSARELTKSTDKLPAVAGIARAFCQQASMVYLAGLWKEDFLSGLFWFRHRDTDTLTRPRPPQLYRAPTWSWASVDGRITYAGYFIRQLKPSLDLKILSYDVQEVQEGSFGQVLSSSFKAVGLLQAVVLDRSKPAGQDDPHTVTAVEGVLHGVVIKCVLDQPSEWAGTLCSCFCLRLGVFDADRRDSVALLLVIPTSGPEGEFRRIGVAETVVWGGAEEDRRGGIDYDIFVAGERVELTMV